jgi:hypothetical protein
MALYLAATVIVYVSDAAMSAAPLTPAFAAALPVLVGGLFIGALKPRYGWAHGSGLGALQVLLFLYASIRIAQTNTPDGAAVLPGTERSLALASTAMLVAGLIGGFLGSLSRSLLQPEKRSSA